jgi:hypothetical protein
MSWAHITEPWDTSHKKVITEAGVGPCAYAYFKNGVARPDLVCPNPVDFTVKLDHQQDRKARLSCFEHLPDVIWQMQKDHGRYDGEYVLTARMLAE